MIGNEVQVQQYSQGNLQAFNTAGLAEVWFAGGYMLCQDEKIGVIDSFNAKIGAGFTPGGLNNLSDTDIKRGVGNGTDTLRVGILTNSQIGRWELCNHLLYDFRGTAPEINGWKFSGQDLADRLNYKFNVGYAVN